MKGKRKFVWAAVAAIVAVTLLCATLAACNDIAGGRKDMTVYGFRYDGGIVLPVKTASSTTFPLPHGVKYFRSSYTELSDMATDIDKNELLSAEVVNDDCVLIERVASDFEQGEWKTYAEIFFVRKYAPQKGSETAKKKMNFYVSGCVCEIPGEKSENGLTTAFLLPLYLMELPSPDFKIEENAEIGYRGSVDDALEFFRRSGCEATQEGNDIIVTDALGSARGLRRNLATKYKLTFENGNVKFQILEASSYKPPLEYFEG